MTIFIDGKMTKEKCPDAQDGRCPECGTELEAEYGFCIYGLGSFDRCMQCLSTFNFEEDT
jgi:hypothetical protein